jgi:serine/threonine protein phosphatase 1
MLKEELAPGRLPPGERLYAIGDVHGCVHRLAALHADIRADLLARPFAGRVSLVHLGDYVDRGLETARVLDLLLGPPPVPGAEMVLLKGNHEEMMLGACALGATSTALRFWLENGGLATLESYGTDPSFPDWLARIPPAHLALLRRCPLRHAAGDYLFVHAGVRPEVPLDRQDPHDLLWIREPFLSWRKPLGAVVVHGHTPTRVPEVRPHRIGIDTGACFGGTLTCLVLEEDRMAFLAR